MDSTAASGEDLGQPPLIMSSAAARVGARGERSKALQRAAVAFLIWTLLALVSGSQVALYHIYNNMPGDWLKVIGYSLEDWYVAAIFAPLIIWLVFRWEVKGAQWPARLLLYAAVSATLVVAKALLYFKIHQFVYAMSPISLGYVLAKTGSYDLFRFGAVIVAAHAHQYAHSLREREVRASQLEARLSRAQLEILRSELQPHFLFNTLHAVSTLMHRNVEAADEMLTQLGDLLRLTLDRKSVQEIPLQEEMAVLERYLGIMRIRFEDRLTVSLEVDPKVADVRVPMFLLQPLVENAIQHGIARRAGAGKIQIRAVADGDLLRIAIADDGPGLNGESIREGIGLSNTRTRLQHLYGAQGSLTIRDGPAGGLQVSVTVPIRRGGASVGGASR